MTKFETLIKIIDELRKEAPEGYKSYYPLEEEIEKLNQARSRAYIHLFLKVKFGLLDFVERENYVTDGINDGGIDAYYIDTELKKIFFIQSKFRVNEKNFESRDIKYEELLNMDLDRVLDGEENYENGTPYNSKVKKLIDDLRSVNGLGRYSYEVIILANTKEVPKSKLEKLTGRVGTVSEYNFERSYEELLFPVVTGTFYNNSELIIEINLSDKSSEDISYSVETEFADCQISVLFVPTVEIAKTMYKYKNSILKYNPRSYLDLHSNDVNKNIENTIKNKATNEFALFNNGITMLSDETFLNKKVAKKGSGQVIFTNPQIINGGQTAYTLSRIYEEALDSKISMDVFDSKEILLKVITFGNNDVKDYEKVKLIEEISKATNSQTEVTEADRRSNDKVQIDLQKIIFDKYGLFYQRKSGEYGEGIKNKYIKRDQIIDRELIMRLALAVNGEPSKARRSGEKVLFKKNNFDQVLVDSSKYKEYVYAFTVHTRLISIQNGFKDYDGNKDGVVNYGYSLRFGKLSVVYAVMKSLSNHDFSKIEANIDIILSKWLDFEKYVISLDSNKSYFREVVDQDTQEVRLILNFDGYYKGKTLNSQLEKYNFNQDLLI